MKKFINFYLIFLLFLNIFVFVNSIVEENTEYLGSSFAVACLILATYYIPKIEQKKADEFIKWINNNKETIEKGEAYYYGARISPDTEVVRFQVSLACLVFYTKAKTRYYIRWHEYTNIFSFKYTMISLLIGWLGLPFAPIYTLQSLFINIKGGDKTTIRELFK
ncbi:MAG: hypothetical protein PHI90_11115 [Clostridia bacterium]|nr:hypothetical protein [Clostridia bacterium]